MLRLAVFASGRGSNLRAIVDAIHLGTLKGIEPVLVISNNSSAEALEIARTNGIEAIHYSIVSAGGDETTYEQGMLELLRSRHIDLIALAGYMKKIPQAIIEAYRGKIVNVHPALLPDFGGEGMYGVHVHKAVLSAGKQRSGATVHFVEEDYDSGAIVLQAECAIDENETPESLARKVLSLEHDLYPKALQLIVKRLEHQS